MIIDYLTPKTEEEIQISKSKYKNYLYQQLNISKDIINYLVDEGFVYGYYIDLNTHVFYKNTFCKYIVIEYGLILDDYIKKVNRVNHIINYHTKKHRR